MAFRFNWPEFDSEFYGEARSQLEAALNKGNKPKNIVDHISVTELNMGTTAPDLEILEIGELSTDKFRGIFKLTYCGDAYIVIQTKVQANPMHAKESDLPRHTRPSVLAADQPLVVPMLLRISDLKLRGIVVLVVSKTKGITLVFKNDPLESILVSSTFDSVTSVRSFLQREIENQLRNLFQEDLPVMIHNLSLRHIQNEQEKASKQQHEEWVKAQQLRLMEQRRRRKNNNASDRSVFSDPGMQRNLSSPSVISSPASLSSANNKRATFNNFDAFSMPDLSHQPPPSTIYSQLNSPRFNRSDSFPYLNDPNGQLSPLLIPQQQSAPATFSSFSDLYLMHQSNNRDFEQQFIPLQQPVIAANLSALNELYSSRFAALKTPPYSESEQQQKMEISTNQDDLYIEDEYDDEGEDDSSYRYKEDASSVNSIIAAEMYADDVDAPWYVTEGPELPSIRADNEKTLTMMAMDEDIILNPKENAVAAKLAQLATVNHTISPFAHTIEHFTFRSLPHTVKIESKTKHKKKPKRRIIRWNTTS
ncbi:Queuine tRNA-ribosyltransferase catalytic subunit 1 [Mucor velutinosus]|uniref:Mitochondrial distribution and morphology protein 34 n=1 Tax=Mucor velutinosus TaxID=708070 RepID=A0AAN7HWV6_9FUNG|nr:Queuine tRNA-ribosyltransferase catalytic subunit 1 [Mucor velutinosus]